MTDEKYLTQGVYVIRATYRQILRVEEGLRVTEVDAIDEAMCDGQAELVEWGIEKVRDDA